MKHVVSFSGGRTSAYLVHLMEQKRVVEGWDVDYVFIDTGAEHPETYEFITNLVFHWNIDLKVIKSTTPIEEGKGSTYKKSTVRDIGWDLTSWKEMVEKYGVPYNPGGAFCTDRLKTVPYKKYIKDAYPGGCITWLGIRIDEKSRLRQKDNYKYLAEISLMKKHDIIKWWDNQPFDLEIDEWLGNCVYCIKKSINKVGLAALDEPELAKEFDEMLNYANKEKKNSDGIMYRGKMSLSGIAKLYSGQDKEQIKSTMRIRRDCGVSSGESCEVFGCQGDLFEGESI